MFICQSCGQELSSPDTYHTHEECLLYLLNKYRQALGKMPIVLSLELANQPSPELGKGIDV